MYTATPRLNPWPWNLQQGLKVVIWDSEFAMSIHSAILHKDTMGACISSERPECASNAVHVGLSKFVDLMLNGLRLL